MGHTGNGRPVLICLPFWVAGNFRQRNSKTGKGWEKSQRRRKPVRQGTVHIIRMVSLTALQFSFYGVVYIGKELISPNMEM